mmetsp:Transcript_8486/g.12660  ORF Transcript_8486/g.12660 Transcript_8486/m.12660 type:complete len:328 (+) Transcript_8486:229-1212(+)
MNMSASNTVHRPSTAGVTRPSSSNSYVNLSRPGTASSSRSLSRLGSGDISGPNLLRDPSTTLEYELANDSLLRIMSGDESKVTNEIILLSEKGNAKGLQKAIDSGVSISHCRGLDGFTPLHHASNRGRVDAVLVILKASVPINARNDSGETALHLAAYMGHLIIVEQLIDCGADIDAQNKYGETALFYAAMKGMPALVRLLLQRGADPDITDTEGDKAIDRAEDPRTLAMFGSSIPVVSSTESAPASMRITHVIIQNIYSYLRAKDIGRAACVAGKWHRASESSEVWVRLGNRRWEYALQGSLGFAPMATASFRPKSKIRKGKKSKE